MGTAVASGTVVAGVAEGTASVMGTIAAKGTDVAIKAGAKEVIKNIIED